MNDWKFEPTIKIGELRFGMDRSDVRKLFGNHEEFKKTKYSKNTTDDFGSFHVFYDENDKCEAIEIFKDIEVSFESKKIFPGHFLDVLYILREIDGDLEIEKDGCISKKHSIGIYAPNGQIEGILFAIKGYYE
jgi:hypothetical protein